MRNKKLSGSFYTPKIIADFLVNYLSEKLKGNNSLTILEPSAGDGVFIEAIYQHGILSKKTKSLIAVEQSKRELNKIIQKIKHDSFTAIHADFLDFQENNNEKFSVVLGNPPYIRKGLLTKGQIKYCKEIHQNAKLLNNVPKNIWTAFLVRCIEFTNDSGILAFVLPSELLQVKFAAELRELIIKEFERVEIFTFNELLFKDCKGQDTLLLIGEKKSQNKGVYYCNIDKLADINKGVFSLSQNVKIKDSKWTHHHLDTDEIELLEKLKQKLQTINHYCTSKAGIVTAANDFFIVDSNTVQQYSLEQFARPIIKKGAFVNGSVVLTEEDFTTLINKSLPTYLIALDKNSIIRKNAKVWSYLKLGEEREIYNGYKMSLRDKWYQVPNIGEVAEAFFFKRCNEYPKLIKNSACVLATDSAYTIAMNDGYLINNLIYSFYNSLTLSFAELQGRYYGGGVLELTPNEFKQLPIPYLGIREEKFNIYVNKFKEKTTIKEICQRNDKAILKSIDPNLDSDSISKIFKIREKLYLRRMKAN